MIRTAELLGVNAKFRSQLCQSLGLLGDHALKLAGHGLDLGSELSIVAWRAPAGFTRLLRKLSQFGGEAGQLLGGLEELERIDPDRGHLWRVRPESLMEGEHCSLHGVQAQFEWEAKATQWAKILRGM